jgi:nondiscriminating aspartyl-tRNA synthetase
METYNFVELNNLSESLIDKNIILYGRFNNMRTGGKKLIFLVLRNGYLTIQCVCTKSILQNSTNVGITFDEILTLPTDSIITLHGQLKSLPPDQPEITSCFYNHYEFLVNCVTVISHSDVLPFVLADANIPYNDESTRSRVELPTRLNNRVIDLRTMLNNALFECKSGMLEGFRNELLFLGFKEINTPKILGVSSESGSSVFQLNYFGKPAFLAQSPQLYKQMLINADFKRVFEIAPVFRSENSVTNRHLCEFTGLDIEMELFPPAFDYHQVIRAIWRTLLRMFQHINEFNSPAVEYIRSIHYFSTPVLPNEPLIITFRDGVKLLQDAGFEQSENKDLDTESERELGRIVKELYGSDLFVLSEYPTSARPFYTKRLESNPNFTKSYDVIFRGVEICSGAQRENDYTTLLNQITSSGMSPEPLSDYLNSFKYGSPPHGGGGLGLERVLILYFNLGNIKLGSLFPRDPSRFTP